MLDATVAGTTATSYLTVAEANALAAIDLGRDAVEWSRATVDEKERALQLATADIDAEYGRDATPFLAGQALVFPRSTDVSGAEPFLPAGLRRATWAQAKYRWSTRDLRVDARARRARGLSSFSDGDGSGTMSLRVDLESLSDEARRYLGGVARFRRSSILSIPLKGQV